MNKQYEDFRFRYQPKPESLDGQLMDYLKKGDGSRKTTEMVLQALRAFWLALACQEAGKLDDEELRKLGLSCCSALENQITYIRQVMRLPVTSATPVATVLSLPGATVGASGVSDTTSEKAKKCFVNPLGDKATAEERDSIFG